MELEHLDRDKASTSLFLSQKETLRENDGLSGLYLHLTSSVNHDVLIGWQCVIRFHSVLHFWKIHYFLQIILGLNGRLVFETAQTARKLMHLQS